MSRYGQRTRQSNAATTSVVANWFGNQFVVTGFDVSYLVIAGGGGGGDGGGGGAGGYRCSVPGELSGRNSTAESLFSASLNTNYSVTVGAGGAAYTGSGNDSVFSTITSTGGGRGTYTPFGNNAASGGSGGGAYSNGTGGAGTAGQGFDGGNGNNITASGAGGGGAGAAGQTTPSTNVGGNGGTGISSSITGSAVTRAGGGGGAGNNTGGTGGAGGGGNGGVAPNYIGTSGTANTGGGGGVVTGAGGSGVVILRYPDSRTITIGAGLTGSESAASGGFKRATITAGTGNVSWT